MNRTEKIVLAIAILSIICGFWVESDPNFQDSRILQSLAFICFWTIPIQSIFWFFRQVPYGQWIWKIVAACNCIGIIALVFGYIEIAHTFLFVAPIVIPCICFVYEIIISAQPGKEEKIELTVVILSIISGFMFAFSPFWNQYPDLID